MIYRGRPLKRRAHRSDDSFKVVRIFRPFSVPAPTLRLEFQRFVLVSLGVTWAVFTSVLSVSFFCTQTGFGQVTTENHHQQNSVSPDAWNCDNVFDEVTEIVAEHFFKTDFDVAAWRAAARGFRKCAIAAESHDAFDAVVNEFVATLGASHTYYYSLRNPKRFQLAGIFEFLGEDKPASFYCYDGIGIDTKTIAGKTYVSAVYHGLPAFEAGMRFGDQILTVDGVLFHPIDSFRGKAGETVHINLIRQGQQLELCVNVDLLDGRTMFETALESSVSVLESGGRQFGYLHVWSYAGVKYHEAVRSAVLWGDLSSCDGLVLDLRDGWGGASLDYLNLFREPIVTIETSSRTQPPRSFNAVWGKPVVLLTNGGSTSGKELFAFGFRKLSLGKIVGEKTAGAVLAGRPFLLSNGDILYLAVTDICVDGKRLEGNGVVPDEIAERNLVEAEDGDPQLRKAIELLSKELEQSTEKDG